MLPLRPRSYPMPSIKRLWCKLKAKRSSVGLRLFSDRELGVQDASAEFHSSVIVASHPPSLPVLNCPFLIFSASSIPEIVTTALSNRLNPSIGRIRCFTLRWSCSTRLFKYWLDRSLTRPGSSPSSFISRTARCEAAYASKVIFVGTRVFFIALTKKRFGGVHVPVPAKEEIDRLARFVDGAVQVHPLPVNLYIGLVHPPRSADGSSVAPPPLLEFRK